MTCNFSTSYKLHENTQEITQLSFLRSTRHTMIIGLVMLVMILMTMVAINRIHTQPQQGRVNGSDTQTLHIFHPLSSSLHDHDHCQHSLFFLLMIIVLSWSSSTLANNGTFSMVQVLLFKGMNIFSLFCSKKLLVYQFLYVSLNPIVCQERRIVV